MWRRWRVWPGFSGLRRLGGFFLPPRFWVCSGFSGFVSEVADLGLRVGFWDGGLGFSGMVDSGLVSGMLDFGSLGSLTRGWSLGWLTGFQG